MTPCKHEKWSDPFGDFSACETCGATGQDLLAEIAALKTAARAYITAQLDNWHVRITEEALEALIGDDE